MFILQKLKVTKSLNKSNFLYKRIFTLSNEYIGIYSSYASLKQTVKYVSPFISKALKYSECFRQNQSNKAYSQTTAFVF